MYEDGIKRGVPSGGFSSANSNSRETRIEYREDNKCGLLNPSLVWPLGNPDREQLCKSAGVSKEERLARRKG